MPWVTWTIAGLLSRRPDPPMPLVAALGMTGLLAPIVVALVVLGFFPGPALEVLNPAVERTLEIVGVGDTIPTVPAGLQLDSGSDH